MDKTKNITTTFLKVVEIMQLIKKVIVKQVLTEKSKTKLYDTLQQDKRQLELECEQLSFEQRKLSRKHHTSKHDIIKRFNDEIERRKDQINLLDFKLEQLSLLDLGSEVIEKEIDAIVNVDIGDKWSELNEPASIIVKDDVVIRIDN